MGSRAYTIVRDAGDVIFQRKEWKDLRKDTTNPLRASAGGWAAGEPGTARWRGGPQREAGRKLNGNLWSVRLRPLQVHTQASVKCVGVPLLRRARDSEDMNVKRGRARTY